MEEIISLHQKEYGTPPDIVVAAPGKITIMGDHTDLGEGAIITAAVDKQVFLAVSRRNDNSLRFYNAGPEERKRTSVSSLRYRREDRWANYPKGVIYAFLQLGCRIKGVNVTILGEVPQGIGLSASAALETGMALALKRLFEFELSDSQLIESARQVETRFMGRMSGHSSILASFYAREGKALYIDTRSLDLEYLPLPLSEYKLLVTNSRVSQGPQDIEYPDYEGEFNLCIEAMKRRKAGRSLRDFSAEDVRSCVGSVPEDIRRRCIHVIEEHERTVELKRALKVGDDASFGRLLGRSHRSLRDQYEISCPELDWLIKRAQEIPGVLGGKMIGSGFGGCTITLLDDSALDEYEKQLVEYDRIFGFKPETFFCRPSDGARVLYTGGRNY